MSLPLPSLQLDVGNSGAKWRLVLEQEVLARGTFVWGDESATGDFLQCAESVATIIVSSVAAADQDSELARMAERRWGVAPWFAKTPAATQTSRGPLTNSYAEPARMGVDRWLAMLAARVRFENAFCVIDVGSALTIDHVDENGQHLGGYIIPGPALMERALLLDTDRVRFEESAHYVLAPGESTAEAVRHGIALAQAGAVALAVKQVGEPRPEVVYTGGAGELLFGLVGGKGVYRQDLVFEGLEIMASGEDSE